MKIGGSILFRDYAVDDLAEIRFSETEKKNKIEENCFVRHDGTLAYFFSIGFFL